MFTRVKILISYLIFLSCSAGSQSHNYDETLPVSALESFLMTKKQITIIDVRTPLEAASGTLERAIVIDIQDPAFEAEISKLDRNQEYLLYCSKGIRSAKALSIMKSKGFSRLYHLDGGYQAWRAFKEF